MLDCRKVNFWQLLEPSHYCLQLTVSGTGGHHTVLQTAQNEASRHLAANRQITVRHKTKYKVQNTKYKVQSTCRGNELDHWQ